MLCSLSNLKENQMQTIKELETELGVTLLAFSCHDAEPAMVGKDVLDKIQAAESKLGMSLVAVKS